MWCRNDVITARFGAGQRPQQHAEYTGSGARDIRHDESRRADSRRHDPHVRH